MQRFFKSIARWEWLILILLTPLLFLATEAQIFLIIAMVMLWMLRLAAGNPLFPRTPFDLSLLGLGLALLISLTAVFDWSLSLPKIAGLILGISLFYAAVSAMRASRRGIWYVLGAFLLSGSTIAMLGLLLRTLLPGILGAAINPNEIAGILAWVVPVLAGVALGYASDLWQDESWQVRVLPLLLQGLLIGAGAMLLLTRSRGGIASVAIALLIMLLIRYRWLRWTLPLLLIGATAIFATQGITWLLDQPIATTQTLSLAARPEIWSRGLYALQDYPLTGLGLNGFREVVHTAYPIYFISPDFDLGHAHNHLLQAGLDLGLGGLIAYLALWLGSAGLVWRGLTRRRTARYRPLLIGLAGSLSAGWLFGILDAIALGARPGFLWWLLLAMLVFSFSPERRLKPAV